jgi:hypothetical protein
MAVKVKIPGGEESHSTGDFISIEDGHLHVKQEYGSGFRTVAIYVPGRWLRAVVEGDTK